MLLHNQELLLEKILWLIDYETVNQFPSTSKFKCIIEAQKGVMADVIQMLLNSMIDGANGDWYYWYTKEAKVKYVCIHVSGCLNLHDKNECKINSRKIIGHSNGMQWTLRAIGGRMNIAIAKCCGDKKEWHWFQKAKKCL